MRHWTNVTKYEMVKLIYNHIEKSNIPYTGNNKF